MIEAAASFHFIRPWFLLLAPLAVALWWLWQRRVDPLRGWREQIEAPLLDALVSGDSARSAHGSRLRLIGWLVAVLAISGPTWRPEPSPFADDATPLLILLKADASMDAADPAPSRRARASLEIADLAAARAGQPLGLIAYAGSAHLVLPPTRDTAVVARMAGEIDAGIMPVAGDRLDLALREAARVLAQEPGGGSVVVIADAVDAAPGTLRALAAEMPFDLQFLAVGTPDSAAWVSLRAAADALGAHFEPVDAGDGDIAAIVRRAAGSPAARRGEFGERWQEAGYWLVPLLALAVLASSRRTVRVGAPA